MAKYFHKNLNFYYLHDCLLYEKQVKLLLIFLGKRNLATVQRLKVKLKELGINYTRIASDPYASFVTAF